MDKGWDGAAAEPGPPNVSSWTGRNPKDLGHERKGFVIQGAYESHASRQEWRKRTQFLLNHGRRKSARRLVHVRGVEKGTTRGAEPCRSCLRLGIRGDNKRKWVSFLY